MEMHLFVTMVMSKFELQLMDDVPEPVSFQHVLFWNVHKSHFCF